KAEYRVANRAHDDPTALRADDEPRVPDITLVHDAFKPKVDPIDQEREPCAGPLRKVAEFVSEDARQLAQAHAVNQGQADGQRQVVAQHAPGAEAKPCGG